MVFGSALAQAKKNASGISRLISYQARFQSCTVGMLLRRPIPYLQRQTMGSSEPLVERESAYGQALRQEEHRDASKSKKFRALGACNQSPGHRFGLGNLFLVLTMNTSIVLSVEFTVSNN
jgi:hypothetical protein